jgi:hypothetical protein
MNWIIRGILVLWAAFFGLTGVQGLLSATPYFELFGITGDATGVNTIRSDLSAFFLVSTAGALLGALVPGWTRALLVPAALFGTALLGRLLGVMALGDGITAAITQAMIAEALSVALMLGALRLLSAPAAATTDAAGTSAPPAPGSSGGPLV